LRLLRPTFGGNIDHYQTRPAFRGIDVERPEATLTTGGFTDAIDGGFRHGMQESALSETFELKCQLLESMANQFEAQTGHFGMRKFESENEALNLMKLATAQVLGLVTVARQGPTSLPTALVASRAAFESSARAAWLLFPADPYDREARWLVHISEEVEYLTKQAAEEEKMGLNPGATLSYRDELSDFCKSIAGILQNKGYQLHKRRPDMRRILAEMGEEKTYVFYSYLSQATHGTHRSTWLYRTDGVGTMKKKRESITEDMWEVPISISRFVFKGPGLFLLGRFGLETKTLRDLVYQT
jgi:hypothetical protein